MTVTNHLWTRVGTPCTCGERLEGVEPVSGLWVCTQCGTAAQHDQQPTHEQQTEIRTLYRERPAGWRDRVSAIVDAQESERARRTAPSMHGDANLERLAHRIAESWCDVLADDVAIELARTIVTPLACPVPGERPALRDLVVNILGQRRRSWGLGLADAMISQLADRAERAQGGA